MKKFFSIAMLSLALLGCSKSAKENTAGCNIGQALASNEGKVRVTQGVHGTVSFTEGDCMPGVQVSPNCRTCPVARKVKVYEYTLTQDAEEAAPGGGFYRKFNSKLIMETNSDADGFFEFNLPPGTYTMAVVEDGLLYANGSDGQGGIHPFTVETGVKQVNFQITYKAAF